MANIEQKINKDAKIAVLCGGMSSEAEVSRRSGKGCFEALQRLGYKNAELETSGGVSVHNNLHIDGRCGSRGE